MKDQASSATLSNFRCPVCSAIQSPKTSGVRNGSFACSRCRTVLEVATSRSSRSLTVLWSSIVISLSLSIAMGLQEPSFAFSVVGATAAFNWLGQSIRKLGAAPELRVQPTAQAKDAPKNVLAAPRPDQPPRATRRPEPLQCTLVVTRD